MMDMIINITTIIFVIGLLVTFIWFNKTFIEEPKNKENNKNEKV